MSSALMALLMLAKVRSLIYQVSPLSEVFYPAWTLTYSNVFLITFCSRKLSSHYCSQELQIKNSILMCLLKLNFRFPCFSKQVSQIEFILIFLILYFSTLITTLSFVLNSMIFFSLNKNNNNTRFFMLLCYYYQHSEEITIINLAL